MSYQNGNKLLNHMKKGFFFINEHEKEGGREMGEREWEWTRNGSRARAGGEGEADESRQLERQTDRQAVKKCEISYHASRDPPKTWEGAKSHKTWRRNLRISCAMIYSRLVGQTSDGPWFGRDWIRSAGEAEGRSLLPAITVCRLASFSLLQS